MEKAEKTLIKKLLVSIDVGLIQTVLGTAVIREAHCDIKLEKDKNKQKLLENAVRGLSVVYLYSFMESHLGKFDYKQPSGEYEKIESDLLFIFKYVRDSFAHSYLGRLFPIEDSNTKKFLQLMDKTEKKILIHENIIQLSEENVHEFFTYIYRMLDE